MSLALAKSCQQFPLETIQKATNYFDDSKIIGKGGFGDVFKGELVVDGSTTSTLVAVKRLKKESKQGVGEFETEIKMLSKCRHCNLVNLLGYCNQNQEMILVYEYVSNGTLADHLYKNPNNSLLTWEQRLKICIGAARGLDYLHTGTGLSDRVIHLDVKSANILLDENFAAKIADLGLSKVGPANQPFSDVMVDRVQGTYGHFDPYFLENHIVSRKTDVYSFGVVLLEVLSGTRASSGEIIPDQRFTDRANWIQQHISSNTLDKIIDRRVVSQIVPKCLECFANTVHKSLHNDPKKRPKMSEVVSKLEDALAHQQQTYPSTSIAECSGVQHFNAVSSHIDLETTSENISYDNHGVSTESEAQASIDSEDAAIWSSMGISMAEYLGKAHNIFGEPIRNITMVQKGLSPTRKNKAKTAYNMMNQGNKYDHALRFVKDLKARFGNGVTTLCLLYNATGETLTYATSRNWFGDIGSSPYPTIIMNGQWGAFLHTKTPAVPSGSVAAVVYRGKYTDDAFCDRMIYWSIPWQRFTQYNVAYCEINRVGHFDGAVWNAVYETTNFAGRESSADWNGCHTRVTVESETSPIYKAVFTLVDAVEDADVLSG